MSEVEPASLLNLHPAPSSNGRLMLHCVDAVKFKDKPHTLILEWRRRDNIWDRECLGHLPTLVSSLHEFSITMQGQSLTVKGRIDPDPWCAVHGRTILEITLAPDEVSYTGTIADTPIQGMIETQWLPAPRPSLGTRNAPLKILEDYKKELGSGRLYDYTHAGRSTSHKVPDLPIFHTTDYGLKPDSGEECLPAIQATIDAAGKAGGGIVQLPAGVLDANVNAKLPVLRVTQDNVYIRGAGPGPDGTLLINHRYSDTPDPKAPWRAGEHPLIIFGPDPEPEPKPITTVTAGQRGSATISVTHTSDLQINQHVLLRQLEDADGSLAKDLVQDQVKPASNYQGEGTALVTQIARVIAINADQVTLDAPLHRDIMHWHTELCDYPMLRGGGITDMRISGHWEGFFIHHKNGEHDNGWDQIKLRHVAGGLIRNIVHEHTTSAAGFFSCLGGVMRDCRIEGNPGHNGFVLGGMSTGCLFLNCHAGHNMHGFNIQGTLSGNALVDCALDEPSGVDLHGCIGCDTLIDALNGGILKGGGGGGAVPPRHGPGFTLWNWRAGYYDPYKIWKRQTLFCSNDQTPGYIAIGLHGAYGQLPQVGTPDGPVSNELQEPWGWVESIGQRVAPRSLYRWQCALKDA